jgi:ferredoxin-NADP reductase
VTEPAAASPDPADLPPPAAPLPPLPSLGPPALADLPPLPTLGPVSRRVPPGGARRSWQLGEVVGLRDETPSARSYRLWLPEGHPHVAGQHYVVRVTADDGSQAQRSYSVASAPDPSPGPGTRLELTVERLVGGAVSPFLHEKIRVGSRMELRGPFGGWFVWRGDTPVLLVGGGSGVVPLMAMLRYWRRRGSGVPLALVVSVRTPEDLYYQDEYGPESTVVYTRTAPAGAVRPPGRLDAATLAPLVAELAPAGAVAYVCGSAGFAETASQLLVEVGMERTAVRVERFGPSG